jgi:hypothetical protein
MTNSIQGTNLVGHWLLAKNLHLLLKHQPKMDLLTQPMSSGYPATATITPKELIKLNDINLENKHWILHYG